jgi:O-methyltransferase
MTKWLGGRIEISRRWLWCDFQENGFGVRRRNMDFLDDPRFDKAWRLASEGYLRTGRKRVPRIRWRVHICCWAASQGAQLDGDFVDCGVDTGILASAVCSFLDFDRLGKTYYLFDTYEGIPIVEGMTEAEVDYAMRMNATTYADVFNVARLNFSPWRNAVLVRGILPHSLAQAPIEKIAYLCIDLNNAPPERQVIEQLWPKLVPGALVVLDDYAFAGHEAQYAMWNAFAASKGTIVASLPTGQGLMIKGQKN